MKRKEPFSMSATIFIALFTFFTEIKAVTAQSISIAGVVIASIFGTLGVVVLALLLIYFIWRHKKKRKRDLEATKYSAVDDAELGPPNRNSFTTLGFDNPLMTTDRKENGKTQTAKEDDGDDLQEVVTEANKARVLAVEPVVNHENYQERAVDVNGLPDNGNTQLINGNKDQIHTIVLDDKPGETNGFNIVADDGGNIFVRDIRPDGPANEKLIEGDIIESVTVFYEGVSYEDALNILSYAAPYKVAISVVRGKNHLMPGNEQRVDPLLKELQNKLVKREGQRKSTEEVQDDPENQPAAPSSTPVTHVVQKTSSSSSSSSSSEDEQIPPPEETTPSATTEVLPSSTQPEKEIKDGAASSSSSDSEYLRTFRVAEKQTDPSPVAVVTDIPNQAAAPDRSESEHPDPLAVPSHKVLVDSASATSSSSSSTSDSDKEIVSIPLSLPADNNVPEKSPSRSGSSDNEKEIVSTITSSTSEPKITSQKFAEYEGPNDKEEKFITCQQTPTVEQLLTKETDTAITKPKQGSSSSSGRRKRFTKKRDSPPLRKPKADDSSTDSDSKKSSSSSSSNSQIGLGKVAKRRSYFESLAPKKSSANGNTSSPSETETHVTTDRDGKIVFRTGSKVREVDFSKPEDMHKLQQQRSPSTSPRESMNEYDKAVVATTIMAQTKSMSSNSSSSEKESLNEKTPAMELSREKSSSSSTSVSDAEDQYVSYKREPSPTFTLESKHTKSKTSSSSGSEEKSFVPVKVDAASSSSSENEKQVEPLNETKLSTKAISESSESSSDSEREKGSINLQDEDDIKKMSEKLSNSSSSSSSEEESFIILEEVGQKENIEFKAPSAQEEKDSSGSSESEKEVEKPTESFIILDDVKFKDSSSTGGSENNEEKPFEREDKNDSTTGDKPVVIQQPGDSDKKNEVSLISEDLQQTTAKDSSSSSEEDSSAAIVLESFSSSSSSESEKAEDKITISTDSSSSSEDDSLAITDDLIDISTEIPVQEKLTETHEADEIQKEASSSSSSSEDESDAVPQIIPTETSTEDVESDDKFRVHGDTKNEDKSKEVITSQNADAIKESSSSSSSSDEDVDAIMQDNVAELNTKHESSSSSSESEVDDKIQERGNMVPLIPTKMDADKQSESSSSSSEDEQKGEKIEAVVSSSDSENEIKAIVSAKLEKEISSDSSMSSEDGNEIKIKSDLQRQISMSSSSTDEENIRHVSTPTVELDLKAESMSSMSTESSESENEKPIEESTIIPISRAIPHDDVSEQSLFVPKEEETSIAEREYSESSSSSSDEDEVKQGSADGDPVIESPIIPTSRIILPDDVSTESLLQDNKTVKMPKVQVHTSSESSSSEESEEDRIPESKKQDEINIAEKESSSSSSSDDENEKIITGEHVLEDTEVLVVEPQIPSVKSIEEAAIQKSTSSSESENEEKVPDILVSAEKSSSSFSSNDEEDHKKEIPGETEHKPVPYSVEIASSRSESENLEISKDDTSLETAKLREESSSSSSGSEDDTDEKVEEKIELEELNASSSSSDSDIEQIVLNKGDDILDEDKNILSMADAKGISSSSSSDSENESKAPIEQQESCRHDINEDSALSAANLTQESECKITDNAAQEEEETKPVDDQDIVSSSSSSSESEDDDKDSKTKVPIQSEEHLKEESSTSSSSDESEGDKVETVAENIVPSIATAVEAQNIEDVYSSSSSSSSESDDEEPKTPEKTPSKNRDDIVFTSGWRKAVKLLDLIRARLILESTVKKLEFGEVSEEEVKEGLKQYLVGDEPIAGLIRTETGEKISLFSACKQGIIRRGTALSLLEAQAATGSIIDPVSGKKMSVKDAVPAGLVDRQYAAVLERAERAVYGFKSRLSPEPMSLFEAMQKNLVVENHGIRLLEAQIATGGIIDPIANHRLPVEVAFERNLFDERLHKILEDPSDDTKGFFDPNTKENLTYLDLMQRCILDKDTNLRLLPLFEGEKKREYSEKHKSNDGRKSERSSLGSYSRSGKD